MQTFVVDVIASYTLLWRSWVRGRRVGGNVYRNRDTPSALSWGHPASAVPGLVSTATTAAGFDPVRNLAVRKGSKLGELGLSSDLQQRDEGECPDEDDNGNDPAPPTVEIGSIAANSMAVTPMPHDSHDCI